MEGIDRLTESQVDRLINDPSVPLDERILLAEEIFENREARKESRGKAGCWWMYRKIERGEYEEERINSLIQDLKQPPGIWNDRGESIECRWTLSLSTAWCYSSILKGNDPRGYMWLAADWNAMKVHPAASINISRLMLITAILERAAGNQHFVKLAANRCVQAAQFGLSRMTGLGGCAASANEMEAAGRIISLAILFCPALGLPFTGAVTDIMSAVEKETSQPFRSCLIAAIERLPRE